MDPRVVLPDRRALLVCVLRFFVNGLFNNVFLLVIGLGKEHLVHGKSLLSLYDKK